MSQNEEQNPLPEELDRHSQQRLSEFRYARESFYEKLAEGAEEDTYEDAAYAADQFARLYKETPAAFRRGLPPTDAQRDSEREAGHRVDFSALKQASTSSQEGYVP